MDESIFVNVGVKRKRSTKDGDGAECSSTSARRKRFKRQVDSIPDVTVAKVISRIRFSDDMLTDIANEFCMPSSIVGEIYKRAIDGAYSHLSETDGMDAAIAGTPDKDHIVQVSDGSYEGVVVCDDGTVSRVFHGSAGTARNNWLEWVASIRHADAEVTEPTESAGDFLYGVCYIDGDSQKYTSFHRGRKTAEEDCMRMNDMLKSISVPGTAMVVKVKVLD